MIEQGVKPAQITAVSFSRKAANEMKARLAKNPLAQGVTIWYERAAHVAEYLPFYVMSTKHYPFSLLQDCRCKEL